MMKILLVEDDKIIATGLVYSLQQEGFETLHCLDAASAKEAIRKHSSSLTLCLFDLSLPDGNGFELCRMVKEQRDIPVIFLTAIEDETNVVMGLDMGADDYITKPFRLRELFSRIKSVMRRYHKLPESRSMIELGDIRVNIREGKVSKKGEDVQLTALEYRLLLIFSSHAGQVLSREQLLEQLWDVAGDFVNDNTLTVYIKRLREKLEDDPKEPVIIKTIRGLGYKAGGD
ncbi:DNA-binding response OmpR family regulator [Paenibacillus qinlingensis]|uniref:DNA-binding response OmpR family regulator n=2 Tax=Paenibacillus qinlingensis TaxID=1837343 RepID=A0ABU1NSD7_9BACL|nr:DNA-binding response OmpR family regulator [Paenibacillus qinlingensis]